MSGPSRPVSGFVPLGDMAGIARIQRKTPVFIWVSVRTRWVRPRFHPRGAAAHGRGPLSPRGVRPGRVTPEQNARHCDTSPQAEQRRLVEPLFVRPCVSHQGDAHGRKQLPRVTVDVPHDGMLPRDRWPGRRASLWPTTPRPARSCGGGDRRAGAHAAAGRGATKPGGDPAPRPRRTRGPRRGARRGRVARQGTIERNV